VNKVHTYDGTILGYILISCNIYKKADYADYGLPLPALQFLVCSEYEYSSE
jgi:hypothetical protein